MLTAKTLKFVNVEPTVKCARKYFIWLLLQLRENNGVEPLVKLLNSGTDDVRRSASWALSIAASDEPTAIEIGRYG